MDYSWKKLVAGGIIPTGELEITENGIHDISQYASANVNVESSGSEITYEQALNKLLPLLAYTENDWSEEVNNYISYGLISSASDVKLYQLYDQHAELTNTITAGSIFLLKTDINMTTYATSLSMYSLKASYGQTTPGQLETNSSDMNIVSGNLIQHKICIAITDITSDSGKYITLCIVQYTEQ